MGKNKSIHMSYTPFEVRVMPLFFYYLLLSGLGILLTIKMFMKWRQRKVPAPFYLSLVFIFFTTALIGLTIGLAEAVITGFFKEIYRFSLPFAYGMVLLADFFVYFREPNNKQGKKGAYTFIYYRYRCINYALLTLELVGGAFSRL